MLYSRFCQSAPGQQSRRWRRDEKLKKCQETSSAGSHLHEVADVLAVWEDLGEVLGAQHVAEGRLSKQARRPVRVFDVRDRYRGVGHAVVDDSVDRDGHRVFRQDLRVQCTHPHACTKCRTLSANVQVYTSLNLDKRFRHSNRSFCECKTVGKNFRQNCM